MTLEKAPKLGPYELLKEQSTGGVGTAFAARRSDDPEGAPLVSVFRVHKHVLKKPEQGLAFIEESRTGQGLSHPKVVGFLEAGESMGEIFAATELAPGETLAGLVTASGATALPAPVMARVCLDVLEALSAAHAAGVVHGELGPNHIVVGTDGVARVAGFGVARGLAKVAPLGTKMSDRLAYAAPERVKAMASPTLSAPALEPRADVFSAGVLVWEALAKQRLFASKIDAAVIQKVLTAPIAVLSTLPGVAVPEALDAAVKNALERDPHKRAQSIDELFAALSGLDAARVATPAQVAELVEKLAGKAIAARRVDGQSAAAPVSAPAASPVSSKPAAAVAPAVKPPVSTPKAAEPKPVVAKPVAPAVAPAPAVKPAVPAPKPAAAAAPAVARPVVRKGTLMGISAPVAAIKVKEPEAPPADEAPADEPTRQLRTSELVDEVSFEMAPPSAPAPSPPAPPAAPPKGPPPRGAGRATQMMASVGAAKVEAPFEPLAGTPIPIGTPPPPFAISTPVPPVAPSIADLPPPPLPSHPDLSAATPFTAGVAPEPPPPPPAATPQPAVTGIVDEPDRKAAVYTARSFGEAGKVPQAQPKVVIGGPPPRPMVAFDGPHTPSEVSSSRGKNAASIEKIGPGSTLGRYEILMPVAKGGMASVWAAKLPGSRGFAKIFAIKTMLPDVSDDPEFESMFLDEGRVAARIRHPNVVEIIDLGEQDDVLYLVMEWVEGENLGTLVKAARPLGGIPLPIVVRLATQICAGLHAAHELRDEEGNLVDLVHRDISPVNVLVSSQGFVKIADFGIAKSKGRLHVTRVGGMVKGKTPYLSPEQLGQMPIDRRSDIFSFGVLLYVLTTGLHPFRGETDGKTIENIAIREPVPLRQIIPTVPEEFEAIVLKALSKHAVGRYDTVAEMQRALEMVAGQLGAAVTEQDVAAFLRKACGDSLQKRGQELKASIDRAEGRVSLSDPEPSAPAIPAVEAAAPLPPVAVAPARSHVEEEVGFDEPAASSKGSAPAPAPPPPLSQDDRPTAPSVRAPAISPSVLEVPEPSRPAPVAAAPAYAPQPEIVSDTHAALEIPAPKKRSPVIAIAAVAVLGIAAVVGVMAFTGGKDDKSAAGSPTATPTSAAAPAKPTAAPTAAATAVDAPTAAPTAAETAAPTAAAAETAAPTATAVAAPADTAAPAGKVPAKGAVPVAPAGGGKVPAKGNAAPKKPVKYNPTGI